MYVTKSGGRRLVYGVDWSAMPGADSQVKEIRTLAREQQASSYVTISRPGMRPLVGFIPNVKGRGRLYSAAALIAQIAPNTRNAIYCFKLDDGLHAMICFIDGLPMSGCDLTGAPELIAKKVREFIVTMGESAESLCFLGDSEVFGEFSGEIEDFSFNFNRIDDEHFAAAQFKAAHPPVVLMSILGVLVVASLGGWYAYDEYQKEQQRKLATQLIDPNQLYEASVTQALKDVGFGAHGAAKTILQVIDKLPVYQAGWTLMSAVCQPPAACTTSWGTEHMHAATIGGFASVLPDGWKADYKSDFQSISVTHPEGSAEGAISGMARRDLPSSDEFFLKVGTASHRLKPLGVTLQFQKPNLFAAPPVPQGQPPIVEAALKAPVKEGLWSASLPFWAIDAVFDLPRNMTIGSLTLNLAGPQGAFLQVEGKFYVGK